MASYQYLLCLCSDDVESEHMSTGGLDSSSESDIDIDVDTNGNQSHLNAHSSSSSSSSRHRVGYCKSWEREFPWLEAAM